MPESVANDFLNGIQEVYSVLLSKNVYLKLLDEEATETNVYDETTEKVYLPAIQLVGKFSLSIEQGEQPVEGLQDYAVAVIPTKELIDKNIAHTPEDYATLCKAVICYEGRDYEVEEVTPRVNIDDVFQFYDFKCRKPKVRE